MNAISGRKRGELFLKWDRSTASWRTCQTSLLLVDETGQHMGEPFLETLPKWATISNMELRVLPMPEPPSSGNGSGSWPTPRNSPAMASGTSEQIKRTMEKTGYKRKLEEAIVQWPTPTGDDEGVLNPGWVTWLMGLPQNWVTLEPVSEESLAEWETRMADGSWWEDEHDLPRTVPSRKGRVDMLKALGNGIVPRTIPTFLNYARSN